MLDALTELCREPIAEMEAAGLTAAKGWYVSHVGVRGIHFECRDGGNVSVNYDRCSTFYRWYVGTGGKNHGLAPDLSVAIERAKGQGVSL